ncbi:hypothetical protein JTE90_013202 [Oedothorax gibbosus]|uniref:Uncharacterized protein n=1 Tax=Oedothorax gibbosus TaxID=931172 RepID=A0AAV6UJB9_9ARAC|nr:hypothetical protein JTE90_013202 [Oedothorax gibbosus]
MESVLKGNFYSLGTLLFEKHMTNLAVLPHLSAPLHAVSSIVGKNNKSLVKKNFIKLSITPTLPCPVNHELSTSIAILIRLLLALNSIPPIGSTGLGSPVAPVRLYLKQPPSHSQLELVVGLPASRGGLRDFPCVAAGSIRVTSLGSPSSVGTHKKRLASGPSLLVILFCAQSAIQDPSWSGIKERLGIFPAPA